MKLPPVTTASAPVVTNIPLWNPVTTGSSMVMMWQRCSELILSMIEASVVLLPEPVGPVTKTSPLGLLAISETTCGSPSSSAELILKGIVRIAAAMEFC